MTPLTTITGLSPEAADLLAAAGIRFTAQLCRESPATLHSRLEVIAWQRGRGASTPALDHLEHWISVARMVTPAEEAQALSVDEIPEAVTTPAPVWLPPSLRAAQAANGSRRAESDPENVRQQSAAAENTWRKVDPNHFATIDAYNEGRIGVKPLSRESLADSRENKTADGDEGEDDAAISRRVQRLRSTGAELSRWVRRGVVHPRPLHTWCGALVSVLWRLAVVAAIAGAYHLIVQVEDRSDLWEEVIAGFVVLLVLSCLQLHFAGRSRCRICSCNIFHSKNCHKNRKAHHLPGLGYVASLSLHILVFGWFRCMYCGTAIRLRPRPVKVVDSK